MSTFENFTHLSTKQFYQVRSLQETAAVNVIGNIYVFHLEDSPDELLKKLQHLNLPSHVVDRMKNLIGPIMRDIDTWESEYITYSLDDTIEFMAFISMNGLQLKWCGIIDYVKMAQLIVGEERFSVLDRFRVACEYCMEIKLKCLWFSLSQARRDAMNDDSNLVKYWKAKLKGELLLVLKDTVFQTEREYGMSAALDIGNLGAIEYFFEQMSETEISEKLIEYASGALFRKGYVRSRVIIVPFFVLKMDAEKQIGLICNELLKHYCSMLLCYLLYWPWQELFVPMFGMAISTITADNIVEKLQSSFDLYLNIALVLIKEYRFAQPLEGLVIHIWSKFSQSEKDSFTDSSVLFSRNMLHVFNARSTICLNAIINGVSDDKKKQIAFSEECSKFVFEQIENQNLDVVRLVVQYLLPRNLRDVRKFQFKVNIYAVKFYEGNLEKSSEIEMEDMNISIIMRRLEKITKTLLDQD